MELTPDILKLAFEIRLIRTCQLVSALLTIYDHLLCVDREIEYIWKRKWSISKTLYLWSRYVGDIYTVISAFIFMSSSVSAETCYRYIFFQGFCGSSLFWTMQVVMQFRIYAMYQSRKVAIGMGILWICEVISCLVVLSLLYPALSTSTGPVPGISICMPVVSVDFAYAYWIPLITFEMALFGLACRIGIKHVLEMHSWNPYGILKVLLRDSFFYFFVIWSVYAANATIWFAFPGIWIEIAEGFPGAFTVIMGCRLILNLREAYWAPIDRDMGGPVSIARFSNGSGRSTGIGIPEFGGNDFANDRRCLETENGPIEYHTMGEIDEIEIIV